MIDGAVTAVAMVIAATVLMVTKSSSAALAGPKCPPGMSAGPRAPGCLPKDGPGAGQ